MGVTTDSSTNNQTEDGSTIKHRGKWVNSLGTKQIATSPKVNVKSPAWNKPNMTATTTSIQKQALSDDKLPFDAYHQLFTGYK